VFAINSQSVSTHSRMASRFAPRRWLIPAATWLWFSLRHPWLAIVAGVIGTTLVLAVWQLPQLPGQFVDEHAAAAKWLLNASTAYGLWGNFFVALGLFDVLRSPLLYLLLALLLAALAIQLADQVGALRQFREVQKLDLGQPVSPPGEALPLSSTRPLYRYRGWIDREATGISAYLEGRIRDNFALVDQAPIVGDIAGEEDATLGAPELRIRGLRHPRVQYLRPLLMTGLLISVLGVWIALAFGWQVTAPPLAPGATYRSANRDLVLHYAVPVSATQELSFTATLQNASVELPVGEVVRRQIGAAMLQVRPAFPAILIATANGVERLTLPGDALLRAQVGLVFADPGSEESILIPDQGAGLRVVQRAGSDGFILELYRSDAVQPVYRADLTPGGQLNVPFGPADPGLVITSMPGLQVDVRHLPGLLLVPVGIFVALIGAVTFLRDSAFVVAQIAPWTPGYSVVILQADRADTIAALRHGLDALPLETRAPTTDEGHRAPSLPEPNA
jgi:hypothetical protein